MDCCGTRAMSQRFSYLKYFALLVWFGQQVFARFVLNGIEKIPLKCICVIQLSKLV